MKAIVCVDDEPSILRALQQQIMRTMEDSFQLEFAESGEEALEVIGEMRERNIDLALLITDEMMPGMKGHVLIERILTQSSSTPCILLTGYAHSEIINQITTAYPITCMSKPWDADELIEVVRRLAL